ncbi:Dpr-interacting protein theta [Carabus blaptoides fortunei]
MKIADLTSNAFICNAQIISPKNDTTVVTLGSNVTLSCVVYGDPVPDIEWHKGSKLIAKYNGSRSTYLNIHYLDYTFIVQEEDLGVYYCSAYNTHDLEKSSTTLTMDVVTK